jgi:hypothetical protein
MIMPPVGNCVGIATDAHAVPLLVRTFPEVLGETAVTVEIPLPISTPLAVSVVAPVPPDATGRTPEVDITEIVTKSRPFQATKAAVPATMVTPVVGPAPTSLILWVLEVLLITM